MHATSPEKAGTLLRLHAVPCLVRFAPPGTRRYRWLKLPSRIDFWVAGRLGRPPTLT